MKINSQLNAIFQKNNFENLNSSTILITGGAGFLGSWLCDIFINLGCKVYCLDDLSTGKVENISHLLENKNFNFIKNSVEHFSGLPEKCDIIIHMAARPSPNDYTQFPVETISSNTIGTFNVLELGRKDNSLILFTSTSEIYGDAKVLPTSEDYWGNVNPIGIRSCYDESKRLSESLLMAYHREYGSNVRIVRIFNTYGPRIRADGSYGRVIPNFITQSLQNIPLTIHGDGSQTRSFCYVTDTLRGILLLLSNSKLNAKPVNIGYPEEITILDLAKKISEKINHKLEIKFIKRPIDDPQRRCPDISIAKDQLNWKPEISLDEGLSKTIDWFKHHY